jgi:hypothetical protein
MNYERQETDDEQLPVHGVNVLISLSAFACKNRKPIAGPELVASSKRKDGGFSALRAAIHIYAKSGERKILSIPIHENQSLKPGLATRIARDTDVDW